MRLIDADALMERLHEFANDDWNKSLGGVFTDAVDTCIDFVENAETIEAVPVVHGEWLGGNGNIFPVYKCSKCSFSTLLGKTAFCPFCGAKMDGKKV